MREIYTRELTGEMIDLIEYHLPGKSKDTVTWYKNFTHETVLYYNDNEELEGMVSYFFLDFKFDMIITAAKDNKFSRTQWKILRQTILNRTKPLRIQSDPNNRALHKGAARLGGVFVEDEVHFPEPGYTYVK
jgi:hypothetical protein